MKVEFSWHLAAQILGWIIQVGNVATNTVPNKYKAVVAAVVGLAQAALHVYATNQPAPTE